MIVRKAATLAAVTLLSTVTFTGLASAQPAAPAGPLTVSAVTNPTARLVSFSGSGPTRSAAIQDAAANAGDLGCSPIQSSAQAAQNGDGSWWATMNAWCGIL
ncbi:hypothetical protein LN042_33090 [Kitasatospora sp. RB6PN24]|uniref:hypothetical protein n=1 Tax=Kitasatospora humi TaxID=2893891 RepID=UPI001E3AD85F|nr:hypothetical protein [Kitasatospora humi]MCC9311843.1 hypothetical protein [Kitasatospora humi]